MVTHVQIGSWCGSDGQQKQPIKIEDTKRHNGRLDV